MSRGSARLSGTHAAITITRPIKIFQHGLASATRAQDALGYGPAVHLRGSVIDAERPHLAEQPRDDRVVRNPEPAQDLHAAVDDPPDRFRAGDFRHARLMPRALALVEQPGRMPDRQSAGVQIHLVVGEHEADSLVLAERLAEGGAAARVIGRT